MFAEGYSEAQLVSVAMLGSFLRKNHFSRLFMPMAMGKPLCGGEFGYLCRPKASNHV